MLMIRYERNNLTQNVTQLRERYKAIQDMIADAQRSPDDYLGQNGDDKNNDIDDIDDIDDNNSWISERTKLTTGASSAAEEKSGQNAPTSQADADPAIIWNLGTLEPINVQNSDNWIKFAIMEQSSKDHQETQPVSVQPVHPVQPGLESGNKQYGFHLSASTYCHQMIQVKDIILKLK